MRDVPPLVRIYSCRYVFCIVHFWQSTFSLPAILRRTHSGCTFRPPSSAKDRQAQPKDPALFTTFLLWSLPLLYFCVFCKRCRFISRASLRVGNDGILIRELDPYAPPCNPFGFFAQGRRLLVQSLDLSARFSPSPLRGMIIHPRASGHLAILASRSRLLPPFCESLPPFRWACASCPSSCLMSNLEMRQLAFGICFGARTRLPSDLSPPFRHSNESRVTSQMSLYPHHPPAMSTSCAGSPDACGQPVQSVRSPFLAHVLRRFFQQAFRAISNIEYPSPLSYYARRGGFQTAPPSIHVPDCACMPLV